MELTISQLAQQIQARLVGEGSGVINGVNSLESADSRVVAFVSSDKFLAAAKKTNAAAIITAKEIEGFVIPQLVVKNVDAALIKTLGIFAPKLKAKKPGIDSTARISNSAKIGKDVFIGAAVVIEDDVEVGDGTVIDSGCKIGQNTKIGKNCRFDYNVAVYHNCKVGNRVIIQANSTIGSTGFGYAVIDNMPQLIPHNGGVIIEDFVEIGANVCIDRAKFDNTVIGTGTKIDNLVQIAHNVKIGKCCFIVAQVGIAGSCKIGNGVILAGQAGIIESINIGDRAIIGAQSGVVKDVEAGKTMVGTPAINARDRIREVFLLERLPAMAKQVEQMSKRLDKLEASKDNSD